MSGWIPNLFGRRDARQSATGAIISLREQLAMLDKKEEYLERKVEAEHGKAKTLVAAKKTAGASAALRRKKEIEKQLDQIAGTRLTLETQVSAIETALFNAETLATFSQAQRALQQIHKDLDINKTHVVLDDLREHVENTNEISAAISAGLDGYAVDEDELLEELAGLEQEALDEQLRGTATVPDIQPVRVKPFPGTELENEEGQIRQLQASLAM